MDPGSESGVTVLFKNDDSLVWTPGQANRTVLLDPDPASRFRMSFYDFRRGQFLIEAFGLSAGDEGKETFWSDSGRPGFSRARQNYHDDF